VRKTEIFTAYVILLLW